MTKEELEKKKSELLYLFKEFDGDRKVEFIKKFPEIWNDCYDIMEESRYHRVMQNSFQSGFDSAEALLLPRLEMAIRFLTILDNELNVSATGLSIYKNEGTHRAIKAAIRELKGEKND